MVAVLVFLGLVEVVDVVIWCGGFGRLKVDFYGFVGFLAWSLWFVGFCKLIFMDTCFTLKFCWRLKLIWMLLDPSLQGPGYLWKNQIQGIPNERGLYMEELKFKTSMRVIPYTHKHFINLGIGATRLISHWSPMSFWDFFNFVDVRLAGQLYDL